MDFSCSEPASVLNHSRPGAVGVGMNFRDLSERNCLYLQTVHALKTCSWYYDNSQMTVPWNVVSVSSSHVSLVSPVRLPNIAVSSHSLSVYHNCAWVDKGMLFFSEQPLPNNRICQLSWTRANFHAENTKQVLIKHKDIITPPPGFNHALAIHGPTICWNRQWLQSLWLTSTKNSGNYNSLHPKLNLNTLFVCFSVGTSCWIRTERQTRKEVRFSWTSSSCGTTWPPACSICPCQTSLGPVSPSSKTRFGARRRMGALTLLLPSFLPQLMFWLTVKGKKRKAQTLQNWRSPLNLSLFLDQRRISIEACPSPCPPWGRCRRRTAHWAAADLQASMKNLLKVKIKTVSYHLWYTMFKVHVLH